MRHQAGEAPEPGPWPGVAWRIRDEHGASGAQDLEDEQGKVKEVAVGRRAATAGF